MKDVIGQEINEGDLILWMSGTTGYAGSYVYTVERLTAKRVKAYLSVGGHLYTIAPENVVVVTSNLEAL